jgi:hypothetical protein
MRKKSEEKKKWMTSTMSMGGKRWNGKNEVDDKSKKLATTV